MFQCRLTDGKKIDNSVCFHNVDEMFRWSQQRSNEVRPAVFVLLELEYLIRPSVKRALTEKNLREILLTRGK